MNISKNVVATLLVMFFIAVLATPVLAGDGHNKMDHSKMDHSKMKHGKMMDHKAMMHDNMMMMQEMMVIIKGLNHKPTPAQSKRLTEMIKKMDKMMKMHNMVHEMDKNGGMMGNPCAMKH